MNEETVKRKRGRPKGSRNKKNLNNILYDKIYNTKEIKLNSFDKFRLKSKSSISEESENKFPSYDIIVKNIKKVIEETKDRRAIFTATRHGSIVEILGSCGLDHLMVNYKNRFNVDISSKDLYYPPFLKDEEKEYFSTLNFLDKKNK